MPRLWVPLIIFALLLGVTLSGCLGLTRDGTVVPEPSMEWSLSPIVHDAWIREPLWVESSVDGAALKVDVYRPEGDGPFPVILIQSPYWSFAIDAKTNDPPTWEVEYFTPRGYAVALGEMRGTRESHGCWDFGGHLDQMDGHDIVEALGAAAWSNGNVGMIGGSHVGMSQIAAAITDPPALKAIVPIVAVTDWYRYLHKDGAPYVTNRGTPPAYFAVHASPPQEDIVSPDWVLGRARTACMDNLEHLAKSLELDGDKDAYWQERDLIAGADGLRAAVYVVHGLLDENVKTDHFLDFWQAIPADVPKKMWIGQFGHAIPLFHEWRDDVHRWFDHFLLGIDNQILDDPAVTVQDNTERTRWEADWPGSAMQHDAWMLTTRLEPAVDGSGRTDTQYMSLPGDDRGLDLHPLLPVATRLEFTSEPLQTELRLAGAARLELQGTLDAEKGRWISVLYDEAPTGERVEITRAYMEARHRGGVEQGEAVPPGDAQDYTLSFYPRDHIVAGGNRIVLAFLGGDLGCSAAGLLGPVNGATECKGTGIVGHEVPITHTVHHGPASATRLLLPVLGASGEERSVNALENIRDDPPE